MNQKQLYDIAIYEETILLTDMTGQHNKRYVIEEEQLRTLFKYDIRATLRPFPGLIYMQVNAEGSESYVVTLKRERRKLIYSDKGKLKHISIEMPNLLAEVSVGNNNLNIKRLWAYPGQLKNSTQLYVPALPNLAGGFCQGSATIKVNGDIIKAVKEALYETPFNHHAHIVGHDQIPFLEYVRQYKGKMPFKSLKPAGLAKSILEVK